MRLQNQYLNTHTRVYVTGVKMENMWKHWDCGKSLGVVLPRVGSPKLTSV